MNPRLALLPGAAWLCLAWLGMLAPLTASAHVVQAIRDYDGMDPSPIPKLMSLTGLYDNAAAKTRAVSAGIKAYEVNTPLWSDGAAKSRYVDLAAGAKITPTDSDRYAIPGGTVFVKNFMIDTVYGDSASRILIETRFMVVRDNPDSPGEKMYSGLTYMWRRDQKDATLLDPGAGLDTLHLIRLNGRPVGKRWSYPSGSDCRQCHQGRGILGFITPQLNRPDLADPAVNQLKALYTAGVFSKDIYKPALHRWTGLKETGAAATAEAKARSYLAANCSHCHGNKVILEGADHDFDFFTATMKFRHADTPGGYVGKTTAKEAGYPQVIYAGYPESSYVMFRMESRGDLNGRSLAQMPPLATFQMDSGAVTAVRDWICSLAAKARTCKDPQVQKDSSYWEQVAGNFPHALPHAGQASEAPRIRDGVLIAPSFTAMGASRQPRLYGTDGKEIALTPLGAGRWKIGAGAATGVYILFGAQHSSAFTILP